MADGIEQALRQAVSATRGHFRYESGHHGDLWLDLDSLFLDAARMRGWAAALAGQAAGLGAEIVCGPLTGGAFLAQFVAAELGLGFIHAERHVADGAVQYRIPAPLAATLAGRRVLVVDDAINAGSAVNLTLAELRRHGAVLAGIACLLTLGEAAGRVAAAEGVALLALAALERGMWRPEDCPLCAAGTLLATPPMIAP
ncbi:orotate phosphoribosyltransferase [Inquilinus ginsengisoli]|jgi:orotate phosphoribosyltransferase|uniref:phosphoribosyltransferase family protein n=1 Tax=Inquilinus ginsengisoli TaxID=363840 RepID=UPI003D1BAB81